MPIWFGFGMAPKIMICSIISFFPSWRSALGNVQLPLEVVGYPPEKRVARCEDLLDSVGLLKFKDAYPHELSGGMKQRVAASSRRRRSGITPAARCETPEFMKWTRMAREALRS
jgi:hypothetical protein